MRRIVMLVCLGLLIGPMVGGAAQASEAVSGQPTPSASVNDRQVKYYVVGAPVNGEPEFLFSIALKTLGDGSRYLEIFTLNAGRRQLDGRLVDDPAVIEPGWTLILPDDASGPYVKSGLLSEITVPAPRPHAASELTFPFSADAVAQATVLLALVALLFLALSFLIRGTRLRPQRVLSRVRRALR